MVIVGLDISLRSTGVALFTEGEHITWAVTSKPPQTVFDVAQSIQKHLLPIIQRDKQAVIFIEDYAFGSFGTSSSVTALIELTGVIVFWLRTLGIRYYKIPPTIVKKHLCGKGNVKKEQMLLHAYKEYGISFANSDECDAFVLADIGYAFLNGKNINDKSLDKKVLDFLAKLC